MLTCTDLSELTKLTVDGYVILNGLVYDFVRRYSCNIVIVKDIINKELNINGNNAICTLCEKSSLKYHSLCFECLNLYQNIQDYNLEPLNLNDSKIYISKIYNTVIEINGGNFWINIINEDHLDLYSFRFSNYLTIEPCLKYNYINNYDLIKFTNGCYVMKSGSFDPVIIERTWLKVKPLLIGFKLLLPEIDKYIINILCFL